MAEVISTIDFDLNTDKAAAEVDRLVKSLQVLDKELADAQAAGRDTTAINAKIAQTTTQVNAALSKQVTTQRAATAQVAAQNKAEAALVNTNVQLAKSTDQVSTANSKVSRSTQQATNFFARAAASSKNLTQGLTRGAAGLANLVGGFGLGGIALGAFSSLAETATSALIEYFTGANRAAEAQARFKENTDAAIGSIVTETRANNALFNELRSSETTQARRIEIAKQLNEQYPDIIGNTNLLTASEKELQRIQNEVNAGIRARLLLQAQEAQAAQIVAEIARLTVETEKEVNAILLERQSSSNDRERTESRIRQDIEALQRRKDLTEQDKLFLKALQDEQKALQQRRQSEAQSLRQTIQSQKGVDALKGELSSLGSVYKEVDKVLSGIDFGSSLLQQNEEAAKGGVKAATENKKAQDELAGSLAALRKEQSRLNKELEEQTRIGDADKIAAIGAALRVVSDDVRKAEEAIKRASQNNVNSLANLRKSAGELRALIDEQVDVTDIDTLNKYNAELKALEAQIKAVENAINGVIEKPPLLPSADLKDAQAQIEVVKIQLGELAIARNRALLQLQLRENEALKRVGDDEAQKNAIRKKFAAERQKIEQESAQETLRLRINEAQQELRVLQETGDAEISQLIEAKAKVEELQLELAKLSGQVYEIDVSLDQKETQKKLKETIEQIASFAEELGGQVIDFVSTANDAALSAAEAAVSRQEQVLNDLLQNEQTANAQQVELERERLDKLNAEREKAKNREAIIAQAQIALNLAIAVARAVAEGGGIASAATVALALSAAIFGFLKAKQASAQAFYDGTTFVKRGAGEPRGRDTVKAFLNEGEAVIPTSTNAAYRPTVEAVYHGRVPASVLNSFVEDYTAGRAISAGAMRDIRSAQTIGAAPVVVQISPDESIGRKVAEEIQKIPQLQMRGDGIYRTVRTKSSRIEKTIKRSKGH